MTYQNPNRNTYYANTVGRSGGAPKPARRPGMIGGLATVRKAVNNLYQYAPIKKPLAARISHTFKHIPHQILSDNVPVNHNPSGVNPNNTKPPPHHGKSTGQGGHGHPMDTGGVAKSSTPILGDYSKYMTNPNAYARAATEAQYGPIISDLLRQQVQQKAAQGQNIADIGSWFQSVGNMAAQHTASDVAAGQAASRDYQDAAKGLAAAFGGTADPSNPVAGMAAQLGAATIAAEGNNQTAYDRQLESIFKAQGAQAQTNETRYQHNLADKLAAQLLDTRTAKGNAYTRNLADAGQQRLQQMAAIQNMQIAQTMLPTQLAAAKASIKATKAGTARTKADTKATLTQIKLANKKGDPFATAGLKGAGDLAKLGSAVKSSMYDPTTGKTLLSPTDAWAAGGDAIASYGMPRPRNNKAMATWMRNVWNPYIRDYNAQHPDHPFTTAAANKFLHKKVGIK